MAAAGRPGGDHTDGSSEAALRRMGVSTRRDGAAEGTENPLKTKCACKFRLSAAVSMPSLNAESESDLALDRMDLRSGLVLACISPGKVDIIIYWPRPSRLRSFRH